MTKSNSFSVTKISMQSSLSNNVGESNRSKNVNLVNVNSCLNFNALQSSNVSKAKDTKKNLDSFNNSAIEDKKVSKVRIN